MAGTQTTTLRERIRIGGIIAICVLAAAAGIAGYYRYSYQKRANTRKLLLQAETAESLGDLNSASTYYRMYLKREPADAAALSAYAAVLRTRLNDSPDLIGDVLGTLRQLIRLEPENLGALEQLANLYLSLGDFALAEQHARSWLRLVPDSAEASIALAQAHEGLLRYDEAVEALKKAVELNPQEPRLYALLVELLTTKADRPQEAAEWLAKAIRLHPESHEIHLVAYTLYTHQRDAKTAEAHLDRALELAPGDVRVLMAAALLHISKGNLGRAKSLLDSATELAPDSTALLAARSKWAVRTNDAEEMAALGREFVARAGGSGLYSFAQAAELFLRAGEADEADTCIEKLAMTPRLPESLRTKLDVLRGARSIVAEEPYTAIPFLERALTRQGPASWAAELLAMAHAQTGAIETAAETYEQILLPSPDQKEIRLALARLYLRLGRFDEVQEHADILAEAGNAYERHATLLRAACVIESAEAGGPQDTLSTISTHLENLLAEDPGNETAIGLLARSIALLDQPEQAIEIVLQAPVDNEGKARLGSELGFTLLDRGSDGAAQQLALELIRRFPDDAAGHQLLVRVYGKTGRLEDAVQHIETTPLPERVKGPLWEIVSDAQFTSGRPQATLDSLRQAIRLQPTNVHTRQILLRQTPDLAEARRLLEQIRQIEGDEGLTWRFERAWFLLQRDRSAGRVREALELLRRCLTVRPGWISARLLLGYASEVMGDLDEAADAYRSAIAQRPRLSDSQAAIRLVRVLRQLGEYNEADHLLATVADAVSDKADLLRLQTEQHLRRKNLALAAETAEQLLSLRSDDPAWAALTVELLLRAGKFSEAEKLAQTAMQEYPEATPVLWAHTRVLLKQDRATEAEALVRDTATRLQRASHYLLLAQLLTRLEKEDQAEQAISKAQQLEPNNASVCSACARFWEARGEFAKQLSFTRQAIELRGEDQHGSLNLARLLATSDLREHREEAAAIVSQRLQTDEEDFAALLLQARLATTATPPDYLEAEKTLTRTLAIDPRSPEAHKLLAAAQIRSGRLNLASDTVSEGLAFAPKDPDLLLASAQILCHQGNYHLAVTPLRWLLEVKPRLAKAVRLLASAYQHTGQVDRAIRMLEELTRDEDRTPAEIITLAKLYELTGDTEHTESLFHRALEAQPRSVEVFEEHLQYHARHGAFDEVYAQASQRRVEAPEDVESILLAGELLAQNSVDRQLRDIGTSWLEEIARDHPDHAADAVYRNALCCYRRGELIEAATLLRQAMQIAPTFPEPVNALAWLYSEDWNDPQKALELMQQFLDGSYEQHAELLDTYGTILLRLDRLNEAEAQLRVALEVAGQTPTLTAASFHLGSVLLKRNAPDEARVYIRRALELNERLGGLSDTEKQHAREMTIRRRQP